MSTQSRGDAGPRRDPGDYHRRSEVDATGEPNGRSNGMGQKLAKNVIDTVRDPMLVLDEDLVVQSANRAFFETFRVLPEKTVGATVYELGNGQWDIPDLRHLLGEVLPKDNVFQSYEVEHDFEEIGRRVMLLNGRKIREFDLILLAVEDVTERREQERALRTAMEQAEKTLDTVREPMLVLGYDLRVQRANDAFYRDFRVRPEDTEGRLVYDLGNGQWDIPGLRELLEDVLPHDHGFRDYRVEHEFPEIGRRSMLLNARRIDHVQLVLLAIEDVTARERDQQALRESETRLDRIVQQVPLGIGLLDRQGRWVLRNPVLEELIPRSVMPSADAADVNRWKAWNADGTPIPTSDWPGARALRGEATRPGMDFLRKGQGRAQQWVRVSAVPYRVSGDEVAGAVVVCEDITGRKQIEEALRESEQRLQEALAIKDEFLALVSHELRTPLTTITGFAQQLDQRFDEMESATRREAVQQLHNDAMRLQVLIENLLILTRLERTPAETEPVLLRRLLLEVVETYRERHFARPIELVVPGDLPPVIGQASWIGQVVQNLIGNADKYSPAGQPIEVVAEAGDGEVGVRVLDRGSGVSEGDRHHVFEPFFRSAQTAPQVAGVGIGLTVCKRLVELHGGTIVYRPRAGGGSMFEFTLPTIEARE